MNKKGFTLVELMVVIVIIGVLAAVAIPRMMAAADRARAAEGPQMLGAISRLQHAFRVENLRFQGPIVAVAVNDGVQTAPDAAQIALWQGLGLDNAPVSRFFTFAVTAANDTTFSAQANVVGTTLGASVLGTNITINQADVRAVGGTAANIPAMRRLVPNWQ